MEDTPKAAQSYRKLAAELRDRAVRMRDPRSRGTMLSAADSYEQLAEVIENTARDLNVNR
jgi:hypothetical protein